MAAQAGKEGDMPEEQKQADEGRQQHGGGFKPIETQDELDMVVRDRISRAAAKAERDAEARYKEAVEKAAKYDEMQERGKTELEKANARAEAAERKAAGYERDMLMRRLADEAGREYGVDPSLLRGEDEESVRSHAEAIKAAIDAAAAAAADRKGTPAGGKPASAHSDGGKDVINEMRRAAGLPPKE